MQRLAGGPQVPLGNAAAAAPPPAAAAAAAAAGVPPPAAGVPPPAAGVPPQPQPQPQQQPPPQPQQQPPAAAAAGPRDFNMAVVLAPIGAAGFAVPGYELPWENYNSLLRENLTAEYPAPAARVPPPPPAAAPAPGPAGNSAEYVRGLYNFVRRHRPNPANIWTNPRIMTLFENARIFVDGPPPGPALVYNAAAPAPYKAAIQAYVNNAANQIHVGIPGVNVVNPLNIGP